jgi:hypothetical protein
MTATESAAPPRHPAKWTPAILDAIAQVLGSHYREVHDVLDPMAGVGGIHALNDRDDVQPFTTVGVELEPEWALQHPDTMVGNALDLPAEWTGTFDAVVTSPVYGNRMSDHHEARDESTRMTYRHYLGRPLSPQSSATMAFPSTPYRHFHERAWLEAIRVVKPGGLLVLNTKNFYEDKGNKLRRVTEFHLNTVMAQGCTIEMVIPVPVKGDGRNQEKRAEFESVIFARTPNTYEPRLL